MQKQHRASKIFVLQQHSKLAFQTIENVDALLKTEQILFHKLVACVRSFVPKQHNVFR